MDRLLAMRLFTCIVDSGSFTRAAQQLGMQRASATQIMKQLESHLGARLLVRTTRHVSATVDGAAYYRRCVDILDGIDEAEASFSHAARHPQGALKVDLASSFARLVVIPALPEFFMRYPQVTLDISVGDRRVDLARESVDCVVRIGELTDSSLVARRVGLLEQVTCASPAYLARHGDPASIDALGDGHLAVNYLSPATGRPHPLEFALADGVRNVTLPGPVSVNGAELYTGAALAGLGIVQVPRYRIREPLANGELCVLLPDCPPPPIPVSVLYPQNRQLSLRVRAFADWLVQVFANAA